MNLKKLVLSAAAVSASAFAFTSVASATPLVPNYTCPSTATCYDLGTYASAASNAYFFRTNGTNVNDNYIVASYGNAFSSGSTFDDIFVFETPQSGSGSGSFSTSFTNMSDSLSDIQVLINGVSYTPIVTSGGTSLSVNNIAINAYTPDTIEIKGTVNGMGSSYDGTATFLAVSAAPEPSTWALMLGGLAFVGMALRRRASALRLA